MPESAKEVAKIAVETSGSFSALWQGLVVAVGGGIAALWHRTQTRFKRIEENSVTTEMLREHVEDQNKKFDNLFAETRAIGKAVSRIEGMLDK